ncbi:MAG: aminotransferase class III-fold pyridoxal phosphate-dependent enzyme, partial [Candidatus Bathyarchaeota archaeon]
SVIGHGNEKVINAIKNQVGKLIACHSSLYNDTRAELIKKIVSITPKGLDSLFFTNSGAESVETAIKLARKYTGRKEIIAMMRSYHGKTFGALSVTWNSKYRSPFLPLVPGVKFVPFGRSDKVRKVITEDTAAIIVEPIQGEGGIFVSPDGYLKELKEISDEKNIPLIFDEVQTGFGRTGKLFACEHWNIAPNILCLAKAAGGGFPLGLTIAEKHIMSSLGIGEHSSTFGGNPVTCAAASASLDVILGEKLWEKAEVSGNYFKGRLTKLADKCKIIREVRGLGLMIGAELKFDVKDIITGMLEKGVIVLSCGTHVLRFLPPCIITTEQIDEIVDKLEFCLVEKEQEKYAVNE